MKTPDTLPRVAITHGDINGIGYEVILKTLADAEILETCTPILYGSGKIAGQYRRLLDIPAVPLTTIPEASQCRHGAVNLINVVDDATLATPGVPSDEGGRAALASLERAVADLQTGDVDLLVTAPIDKHSIQSPEFQFPGHTEYLESQFGEPGDALMLMVADKLRVALVTTHVPVAEIASHIASPQIVLDKIVALDATLRRDFDLDGPRIAVLALNPHGGDHGLLGAEEETIIAPAIQQAADKGILAFGPYSPDGFWGSRMYDNFDAVLAMYHDQGLAPFKTLARDEGVNYTAGLSIIRTSPDHGTAYDITGKGQASPMSMRHALWQALDIYAARRRHDEATASPLRKTYHDRGRDNVVLDLTKD